VGNSGRRTAVIAVLACAILVAIVVATGGNLQGPSAPTPTPLANQTGVKGTVSVRAAKLHDTKWTFRYTVENTGSTPIAGFQINGPTANLYDIHSGTGWIPFGSGVCHGNFPGILIYWSIGPGHTATIPSGGSSTFTFRANTRGIVPAGYSLSYGSSRPYFGTVDTPHASTLPASGPCR
jgi:hypothetical protein